METGHDLETLSVNTAMARKKKKVLGRWVLTAAGVLVVLWALGWYWQSRPGSGYTVEHGFAAVEHAFYDRRSGFMTEVSGNVTRILKASKDRGGSQDFVIQLENGLSLLIVHESSASRRVPLAIGDRVTVRGEYTWSETGGTVKHTRRDLSPKRRHGFVEHDGKRYQ